MKFTISGAGVAEEFPIPVLPTGNGRRLDLRLRRKPVPKSFMLDVAPTSASALNKALAYTDAGWTLDKLRTSTVDQVDPRICQYEYVSGGGNLRGNRVSKLWNQPVEYKLEKSQAEDVPSVLSEDGIMDVLAMAPRGLKRMSAAVRAVNAEKIRVVGAGRYIRNRGLERYENVAALQKLPNSVGNGVQPNQSVSDRDRLNEEALDPWGVYPISRSS